MPRVNTRVKSARGKQYTCSACGEPIEAGQEFYYWSFRYGGTRRQHSKHGYPRRSQLTQSKMGEVYSTVESVEDLIAGEWVAEDVETAMEELRETVEQVKGEYEEAAEHFGGGGPNQEHAEELESFEDTLGSFQMPDEPEPEREEGPCSTCKGTGKVVVNISFHSTPDMGKCEDCDGEGHRVKPVSDDVMEEWREDVKGAVEDALSEAP